MKTISALAACTALLPLAAYAKPAPLFAAGCAGGVNRGGYNIDTDDRGHLWVNGHRVTLEAKNSTYWEAGYHGVNFEIAVNNGELLVSWTGHNRDNGICTVVAQ
jgi:hypothetical protein